MKSRFYGSKGNFKDVPYLLVGELVKIGEEENLPEVLGHGLDCALNHALELFAFHGFARLGFGGFHQVDELATLLIRGGNVGLEWIGRPARLRSHQIARFISGDCEEPGAEAAGGIELVGRLVDLEKRFLENILCGGAIAQKPHEKVEKLALIALHQGRESGAVAGAIRSQKILIRRLAKPI